MWAAHELNGQRYQPQETAREEKPEAYREGVFRVFHYVLEDEEL